MPAQTLALPAGARIAVAAEEWRDAFCTVAHGRVRLELRDGEPGPVLGQGAAFWLRDTGIRALHNPDPRTVSLHILTPHRPVPVPGLGLLGPVGQSLPSEDQGPQGRSSVYELQAVIADGEVLRAASKEVAGARAVPLPQGLALMPMTGEVVDALTGGGDGRALGFWRLPTGFDQVLARWSTAGPIAYVEAEYFGGAGEAQAAVWADGVLVLEAQDEPTAVLSGGDISAVSQALQRLGVRKGRRDLDEFEAVGLGRHRSTEDWLSSTH
jgi:hypothetical protein